MLWRILRWIEEYEAEEDMKKQSSLRFLILEMSGKFIFQHELNKATYILYIYITHACNLYIFSCECRRHKRNISLQGFEESNGKERC